MNRVALKAAARWCAQLCSGEATEADRLAWNAWFDAHPDHRWAWQQVETLQGQMQTLPGKLSATAFRIASTHTLPHCRQGSRRNVFKNFVMALVCGSVAWFGWNGVPAQGWLVDYRTVVGERSELTLADGSTLILNTDTAVDVIFDAAQRLVKLRRGEILIETAADPVPTARPFIVETAQGRIRALGTRFTVRQYDDATSVAVLRDAVEIQLRNGASTPQILSEGRQAQFSLAGIQASQPADELQAAWTRGMVIAADRRLADLVAELARYRPGRLVCDPDAADLRISGAFPLHDTDIALAAIGQALPVQAVQRTRYWVTVESR